MIILTDTQLSRLASHFQSLSDQEKMDIKWYPDGRPRYRLVAGINRAVIKFNNPKDEMMFKLRFLEYCQ